MKRSSVSSSRGAEWMASQLGRREKYKKHAGYARSLSLPPRSRAKGWVEKQKKHEEEAEEKWGKTDGNRPIFEEAKDADDELQHIHFEYAMAPSFEQRAT